MEAARRRECQLCHSLLVRRVAELPDVGDRSGVGAQTACPWKGLAWGSGTLPAAPFVDRRTRAGTPVCFHRECVRAHPAFRAGGGQTDASHGGSGWLGVRSRLYSLGDRVPLPEPQWPRVQVPAGSEGSRARWHQPRSEDSFPLRPPWRDPGAAAALLPAPHTRCPPRCPAHTPRACGGGGGQAAEARPGVPQGLRVPEPSALAQPVLAECSRLPASACHSTLPLMPLSCS